MTTTGVNKDAPASLKQAVKPTNGPKNVYGEDFVRSLVLDYLSHNGYVSSARTLSQGLLGPFSSHPGPSTTAAFGADGDILMASIADLNTASAPIKISGDGDEISMDVDGDGEGGDRDEVQGLLLVEGDEGKALNGNESSTSAGPNPGSNSGLMDDRTLLEMQLRKDICDHILAGEISEAVSALNNHFPSLLNTALDPSNLPPAESIPNADDFASGNGIKNGGSHGNSNGNSDHMNVDSPHPSPDSSPDLDHPSHRARLPIVTSAPNLASGSNGQRVATPPPTYIVPPFPYADTYNRPVFLSINLEIQGFVESLRHLHIPSSPSSMTSSFHSDYVGAGIGRVSSPAPHSNGHGLGSNRDNNISTALASAQKLHSTAKSLGPSESKVYLKEIENVCALLAYMDMDSSPLKGYLDQGRRMMLAAQVNSAILVNTGHAPQAILETVVKQTTHVWQTLTDHGLPVLPPWTAGVEGQDWERLASYFKTRRAFDLGEFLRSA